MRCAAAPAVPGFVAFVVLREVTEGLHRPLPELNPEVSDELAGVIDHLLAKNPDDRIQSGKVAELLSAIEEIAGASSAQPSCGGRLDHQPPPGCAMA
jgi:hypothetical protein